MSYDILWFGIHNVIFSLREKLILTKNIFSQYIKRMSTNPEIMWLPLRGELRGYFRISHKFLLLLPSCLDHLLHWHIWHLWLFLASTADSVSVHKKLVTVSCHPYKLWILSQGFVKLEGDVYTKKVLAN